MIINGVELEFDIYDVEIAAKYEKAMTDLAQTEDYQCKNLEDDIRFGCQQVFNVFDTIFGDGTAEKIFRGKVNLVLCLDCVDQLVAEGRSQAIAMAARRETYDIMAKMQ